MWFAHTHTHPLSLLSPRLSVREGKAASFLVLICSSVHLCGWRQRMQAWCLDLPWPVDPKYWDNLVVLLSLDFRRSKVPSKILAWSSSFSGIDSTKPDATSSDPLHYYTYHTNITESWSAFGYDHTQLKAPDPVRSPQLNNCRLG